MIQAGQRNACSQKSRDNHIRILLEDWNFGSSQLDAFERCLPENIRPTNLGDTAISNLRSIARKTKNDFAKARQMFIDECRDKNGRPVPLGWGHTSHVLEKLKEAEAGTPGTANPTGKDTTQKATSSKAIQSNPTKAKVEELLTPSPKSKAIPKPVAKVTTPNAAFSEATASQPKKGLSKGVLAQATTPKKVSSKRPTVNVSL